MRAAEVVEQLLVGGRLLERVQVAAVEVLEQCVAQHRVVAGVSNDRRDRRQASLQRGAPAPLPHDQLVASGIDRAQNDRLQQTDLADRVDELRHRFLVEDLPRLLRIGSDGIDRDLRKVRSRNGQKIGFRLRRRTIFLPGLP